MIVKHLIPVGLRVVILPLALLLVACPPPGCSQGICTVIRIVDGNTVELEDFTQIKLMGIVGNPTTQAWLEKNVLHQVIRFQPDQQDIHPEYVSGYICRPEDGYCINYHLLRYNISSLDETYNYDSLSVYRSYNRNTTTVIPPPDTIHHCHTLACLVKQVEPAVFFVYSGSYDSNYYDSQGSGFFINPSGIAITNHHVYDKSQMGAIQLLDGSEFRISQVLEQSDDNDDLDYVIFSIENPNNRTFPYLKVSNSKPDKGQEIFAIGNPQGIESTVTKGIISNINSVRDGYIQIDAAVSHGSSGGPLFNLEDGTVLGVVTFGLDECENCNFALDIHKISGLDQYISR